MLCAASPAHGQEAVLDGVSLGRGEAAALGQPVHGVEQGVDQRGVRLRAGKQRCALSQQGQHSCAQVPVEGQSHVRGTENRLQGERGQQMEGRKN